MPEKVTISHRGAKYEIGRGKRFYGIWVVGTPASDPIDRWPETGEGWAQAWARFTAMEDPATITSAEQPRTGWKLPRIRRSRAVTPSITDAGARRPGRTTAAAGLLGLGVLLGLIGLFPGYVGSQSLASQADQLVPHLIYLVAWAASGVLIALGARRARLGAERLVALRVGAMLGTGLSAITFGLFLADLGEVISGGWSLLGAGLVLSLLGWVACAAGSVLALTTRPGPRSPVRTVAGGPAKPRLSEAGPIALVVLAAIGAVAAFAPSWDSYTLIQATTGTSETVTLGNAFANPGAVIAGNVVVMIAVIAVAVIAALWHPVRQGAVLLAGATVPLFAQAISALIQVTEPATAAQFGISSAEASATGLTITSGVTPIFWVYCVFVISLVVSCAWMLTAPQYPAMPTAPAPARPGPVPPIESGDSDGESGDSDGDAEDDEETTFA